ncbi:hypothetical protein GCM10022232_57610 [Streptomyces plumbiresistens]|uniref:Uncharacterized protein n=1 Tax=Streptomyces plumbiresistens TaxID=511811 RepID=A0ABP7SBN6_9ACTN
MLVRLLLEGCDQFEDPELMVEGPVEPTHHHVHTAMRAPNGGGCGMAVIHESESDA